MAKKRNNADTSTRRLIKDDTALFDDSYQAELEKRKNAPVECLDMTFPNDDTRRQYFLEKLRAKLFQEVLAAGIVVGKRHVQALHGRVLPLLQLRLVGIVEQGRIVLDQSPCAGVCVVSLLGH